METVVLNKVAEGVFKKSAHEIEPARIKEWTRAPSGFKLATRCCDGSFHVVNSEIKSLIEIGIGRNDVKRAVSILAPIDPIHGQRFVIFEMNPSGKAFLLGTVEHAVVELARHG